ncbi:MAG: hypothetical protein EXS11_04155 [Gemmataceae bacterium]|nr:hypothetical protein [Gemmataceae bacterium]
MKKLRLIAGIAIVLLLGVSVVVSFQLPAPIEVAQKVCSEKGFPAQNLALLGYRGSNGLFANWQTVEFQLKGANPAKRLVVELNQPVYFLPWQTVDFREEAQP